MGLEQVGDTEHWAPHQSTDFAQQHAFAPNELGLEPVPVQPVLVVCSVPPLAAAVAFQERVID